MHKQPRNVASRCVLLLAGCVAELRLQSATCSLGQWKTSVALRAAWPRLLCSASKSLILLSQTFDKWKIQNIFQKPPSSWVAPSWQSWDEGEVGPKGCGTADTALLLPQAISISKAINTQEAPVKEKHARRILSLCHLGGAGAPSSPTGEILGLQGWGKMGFSVGLALTDGKGSFWGRTTRRAPSPFGPTPSGCPCPAAPSSAGSSAMSCTKSCVMATPM